MKMFENNYPNRFSFLLEHFKPGRILDVGNIGGIEGEGLSYSNHFRFREHLRQKHPDSTLVGLDLYKPKVLREQYEDQVQGNILEPPFAPNTFDTVYVGEILEHLEEPYAALRAIHNILKPTGRLILDTPNPYALARFMRWILLKQESLGDPTHKLFYTPIILKTLVTAVNYEIIEMATDDKVTIGKGISICKILPSSIKVGWGSHLLVACKKGHDLITGNTG